MTSAAASVLGNLGDVDGMNVLNVSEYPDVVAGIDSRYTGLMPRQKNPDELTASAAIELLGTYRQYFYDLVKAGRIRPHYRKSAGKRAFYLRSEVLALKEQLDAEDQPNT